MTGTSGPKEEQRRDQMKTHRDDMHPDLEEVGRKGGKRGEQDIDQAPIAGGVAGGDGTAGSVSGGEDQGTGHEQKSTGY